ncbi:MAG: hypothetical protein JJU36_06450 [Phycisphaeraceae bacterium]|nr:hypothetical protein [Phycisphaeraceae bacterium]
MPEPIDHPLADPTAALFAWAASEPMLDSLIPARHRVIGPAEQSGTVGGLSISGQPLLRLVAQSVRASASQLSGHIILHRGFTWVLEAGATGGAQKRLQLEQGLVRMIGRADSLLDAIEGLRRVAIEAIELSPPSQRQGQRWIWRMPFELEWIIQRDQLLDDPDTD